MLCKVICADVPGVAHQVISLLRFGPRDREFKEVSSRKANISIGLDGMLGFFRFRSLLRGARSDVIICWMYWSCLLTVLLAEHRRAIIWNIRHSLEDLSTEKPSTRLAIRLCAFLSSRSSAIIYCSRRSMAQHSELGFCQKRAIYIPNGFDVFVFQPKRHSQGAIRRKLGLPDGAIIVGQCVRYHPMKNQHGLLTAFAETASTCDNLYLVLAGRDVNAKNAILVQAINELCLGERVRLLGMCDNMAELYPCLDIYVSASLWGEGFPNVLGEAMACGVPCIATDVGDSAEVVGDTGKIVPPGDVLALRRALDELIGLGRARRAALGAEARRRVEERFDIVQVAQSYANLAAAVASNRGK